MKPYSAIAVGLIAGTALLTVSLTACNSKSGSSSSSSSKSSSSTTSAASSSAASSPGGTASGDYSSLLIKASDINAPGDTFTMQGPAPIPNNTPGVEAQFTNQAGTRVIGDTIAVLNSPSDATGSLEAAKTTLVANVVGGTPEASSVGTGGTVVSGKSPDGSKSVTVLLFTEGKGFVTLEFDSAADDPVPPDFVSDVGQKQDAAIKSGLPS